MLITAVQPQLSHPPSRVILRGPQSHPFQTSDWSFATNPTISLVETVNFILILF